MATRYQGKDWANFKYLHKDNLFVKGHYISNNNNICLIMNFNGTAKHWCSDAEQKIYLKYISNIEIIKTVDKFNNTFYKLAPAQLVSAIFGQNTTHSKANIESNNVRIKPKVCPYCGEPLTETHSKVKVNSNVSFGCEGDDNGYYTDHYYLKCNHCKTKYDETLEMPWVLSSKVKKELLPDNEISEKQHRALHVIYSHFNLPKQIFFSKMQVSKFIGKYLSLLDVNN